MKDRYLATLQELYGMVSYYSGITDLFYRRSRNKKQIWILSYHQIDSWSFEAHLRYLIQHYKIVPLSDVYRMLTGKSSWLPGALALTFDDGHLSFYKKVFPVLLKYRTPATLFVATDFVGTGKQYWFDWVDGIIEWTKEQEVQVGDKAYPIGRSNRYAVKEAVKNQLKAVSDAEKQALIESLAARSGYKAGQVPEATQVIDWDQAAEMQASGMVDIGGHTCSHPILTRVPGSVARREIMESRHILQTRLGTDVEFFAYPNGDMEDINEEVMGYVQEAGYRAAVTLREGVCQPGDNLFALRRISTSGGFAFQTLATKMSGLWLS